MKSLIPILVILALATAYGLWYKATRGKIRATGATNSPARPALSPELLGGSLGSRASLVQFSSAFCTPCRATRLLLESVVLNLPDVTHIEIDAEAHLDLVRELGIHSTPTTLILNSQGVEVGRAVGAPSREQVLKSLAAIS